MPTEAINLNIAGNEFFVYDCQYYMNIVLSINEFVIIVSKISMCLGLDEAVLALAIIYCVNIEETSLHCILIIGF